MTDGTTDKVVQCPECGADNDERRAKCWLCGANVAAGVAASDSAAPGTAHAPPQFGLSSLFLILTLVCVCLGLISIAPGLIVLLLVIVVPALIRTFSASDQWTRRGAQMTTVEKFAAFFTSLGIVLLIWVAGIIALFTAFFIICVAGAGGGAPAGGLISFVAIGIIGALVLMGWLFVITWPGKK
jgi:hypothetical protein